MANYSLGISGILPAIALIFILFTERGKGQGTDLYSKDDGKSLLPTGLSGWWGENDTQRDVWATRGTSVILPCQISNLQSLLQIGRPGKQFANVTWLKDNETLQNRRSFITPEGHLNITKLMRRRSRPTEVDDGEYRCVVAVMSGVPWVISSTPLRLRVADIRHVNITPGNVSLIVGESLRLCCQTNSQPSAHYTWVKIGSSLPQGDRVSQIINSNSGVLQITNVQKSHGGSYKCTATNTLLNKTRVSDAVQVSVKDHESLHLAFIPPTFLFPSSNYSINVVEGRNTTLECLATGLPMPAITWQRKITVDGSTLDQEITDKEFSFIGVGNLYLSEASAHHAGIYVCKATSLNPVSGTSTVISVITTLKVVRPPVIVNALRNVTTLTAKTVRLNCSLSDSVPFSAPPRISWYKNGYPIVTDTRVEIRKENQLVFINSITKDTGVFQCMVENDAGYAMSWSYLLVNSSQDHPSPPQNLRCLLLSSTSVYLSWDPVHSSASPLQAYSIHYTKLGGSKPIEFQEVAENNSLTLDALIPHTNYSFHVRAYSTYASDPSETVYFTTNEDVPIGAPEFDRKATSPSTMLVTWSPLPPEKARGTITKYKVQWQRRSKHYYNLEETEASVFQYEIPGLHPGKTYKVRVVARTSVGYNAVADWPWKVITMPEVDNDVEKNIPMAPQLKVQVIGNSNSKSINVSWSRHPDDATELTEYILKYKPLDDLWSKDIRLPATASYYLIQNLETNWYRVKLRGLNYEGEGASAVEVVHTEVTDGDSSTNLPTIADVKVSLVSQTIVNLSWKVMKSEDQEVAFYTICQTELNAPDDERPVYRRSTRNTISIDGLTPFSIYELTIRAHLSENEYGPYSAPVETTPVIEKVPVTPKKVDFEAVDASTIELRWENNDVPTKYQVIYSINKSLPLDNWNKEEVHGNELGSKISGLVSNTEYWFRIRGCSDMNCGSFSEPLVASIPAILPPTSTSSSQLYLIVGLVGTLALLMLFAFLAFYILKFRNLSSPPLALSCDGNGSIKHNDCSRGGPNPHVGRNGIVADINGTDGDYIPMLNRIHTDLPQSPLDTKGGHPPSRVNGFTNLRCNGVIRGKELHYGATVNAGKAVDSEECEHLFTPSSTPSVHSRTGDVPKTPEENLKSIQDTLNTQLSKNRHRPPTYNT